MCGLGNQVDYLFGSDETFHLSINLVNFYLNFWHDWIVFYFKLDLKKNYFI